VFRQFQRGEDGFRVPFVDIDLEAYIETFAEQQLCFLNDLPLRPFLHPKPVVMPQPVKTQLKQGAHRKGVQLIQNPGRNQTAVGCDFR
jgi:hypothetical protein